MQSNVLNDLAEAKRRCAEKKDARTRLVVVSLNFRMVAELHA